ncbi:hypothetical protein DPV78_011710 [Talaromyces pinophilus]|nr:hypothetical protein DPV78_011710 [Talaromyces pinophilus]
MPSLLDLPREILDEILYLVLLTPPQTSPQNSYYNHQRRELTIPFPDPQGLIRFYHLVKVLPSHLQYNAFFATRASLLLLNHQLNAETLSLVRRKHPSTTQYVLDVAVVNDLELWPTWISVPLLAREVGEVYVSIRTITTQRLGWKGKTNKWLGGDGVPPLSWAFGSMLQLFLCYGPLMDVVDHSTQQEESNRKMTLRRLVLDVRSPSPTEISAIAPYNPEQFLPINISHLRKLRRNATDINYVMHPGLLLELLTRIINRALNSPSYSRLLYERIGTIEIMLDGDVRNRWDLLEWFLRPTTVVSETERWSVYRERQKMGLPVPESSLN